MTNVPIRNAWQAWKSLKGAMKGTELSSRNSIFLKGTHNQTNLGFLTDYKLPGKTVTRTVAQGLNSDLALVRKPSLLNVSKRTVACQPRRFQSCAPGWFVA